MVYYSLSEYVLSIAIATIAAFIGITLIRKMKDIERKRIKIHPISFLFGSAIYVAYLHSNFSDIQAHIDILFGIAVFFYSAFAVNTAINTICLKDISFVRLLFGAVIFSLCISLVNMIDIRSEMMANNLKLNLFLFVSANILLIGNTLATIRFIRQLRSTEIVSWRWLVIGSFAIGMAFASIRFTLFSSITLFSNVHLFTDNNIPIQEWIYMNKTWLPLMINIFALVFLELVPSLFSDFHRKKQEELMIENKQRYETLFDNEAIAIFSLDQQERIVVVNTVVKRMIGFQFEELATMSSFEKLIHHSKKREFSARLRDAFQGQSQMFETKMVNARGESIHVQITLIPIFVKEQLTNMYVLAKDITEVIQAREKVRYLAYHDSLTQLPNRRYFVEQLSESIHEAAGKHQLAVCFLDVDRFKLINDILGHQTGDELLKMLSDRFIVCVEEHDTVARMGGDEFTFLFPSITSCKEMKRKVEEIIELIQKPFYIDHHELYVTGSIGIAIYPDDGLSGEELMKNADAAMYRAKEKGKNTYEFFHTGINEQASKRLLLEKDLRKAMMDGQLEIYYQPQVNMSTKETFSVEALVRWNHPEEGVISPGEFIPIAEEIGTIGEIGEWVLLHACKQVKSLHDEGFTNLQLSVNVSFKQFYNKQFVSSVKTILEETSFKPDLLDLEITESMAMKDIEYAKLIFKQLRQLGISISIDDFGTGYSSLNHIKNFPIDRVKIDGSFVRDIPNNPEAVIIIKTIIAMAKNLQLASIAEHVENEEQYNFLQSIDCEQIQGHHCAPPLNKTDLRTYLHEQFKENKDD